MLRVLCALLALTVVVVDAQGPSVAFVARWGGISKDTPASIVADRQQGVFVVGTTYSHDFPIAHDRQVPVPAHTTGSAPKRNWCVYATKLDAARGAHVYASIACGRGMTWGRAAAVSDTGELWAAGSTDGPGFPVTPDAVQRRFGGSGVLRGAGDAFVLRWSADGRTIRYATYLGGSGDEQATALVADSSGVWVAGYTTSRTLASDAGIAQPSPLGGSDAFLVRIDGHGRLVTLKRFGGPGDDVVSAMTRATPDRLVLVGHSTSPSGTFGQSPQPGAGSFVLLFDTGTESIVWQQRLGDDWNDRLHAVSVLEDGRIVAVGESGSANCDGSGGKQDGWVVILSARGVPLQAFCIGGREVESARGVAIDGGGTVWVTGVTDSPDFAEPAAAADARALVGYRQAFVASIDIERRGVRSIVILGSDEWPRNQYAEGQAVAALGDRIVVAGDIGDSHGGRIPSAGGQILPTAGAFGHGQRFSSHDSFAVALGPVP